MRKVLALLALLFGLTVLALRTQLAWDSACSLLRRQLSSLTGLKVEIESCQIDPLTQTLSLKGLSASRPGAGEPVLFTEGAQVSLRWKTFGGLAFRRILLERPRLRLEPSSGQGGKEGSCPLRLLRRLEVDQLEVRGASVRAALPGQGELELGELGLSHSMRRQVAELGLTGGQGVLRLGERELKLSGLTASARLDLRKEVLELTGAKLLAEKASLELSGKVESLCDPSLSLRGQLLLPLDTLARAWAFRGRASGELRSRFSISGPVRSPLARLELSGSGVALGPAAPGDFTATLDYAQEELVLREARLAAGGGELRASGSLRLAEKLPVKLKLVAESAQFARLLEKAGLKGSWVDFPTSGQAAVEGVLRPSLSLAGEAGFRSGRFTLATAAFDAPPKPEQLVLTLPWAQASCRLAIHSDRVELSQARLESAGSQAEGAVTLYFDQRRGLSVEAKASAVDLSPSGQIAGLHWAGKGQAELSIHGPYRDVSVESQVWLRDFELMDYNLGVVQGRVGYQRGRLSLPSITGQKGKSQYFGSAFLDFGPQELQLALRAEAPRARGEDLIDAVVRLHPALEVFQGTVASQASASFSLEGPARKLRGKIRVELGAATFRGRRLGEGHAELRLVDGQWLVLDKAVLEGPLGSASAEGSWAFTGPLDYRFRYERISLAEVVGLEQARKLGISGTLTLAGKVEGDDTTPVVSMYLTSPRVTFGGKPLGSTHLEGRVEGRQLQVFGKPFGDARAAGKLRIREPYPFEGSLSFSLPEIRPLLPQGAISQGLSGSVSGKASASGLLGDLKAVQASAKLDQLSLSRGDFTVHNDRPISLAYQAGGVTVDSFGIKGPNTRLHAQGQLGPKEVSFGLHGTVDMRLLESFVADLERTGGQVELTASADGPVGDPSIVGRLELHEARLSWRDRPLTLRSLSGQVEFSESRVLVQDLTGVLNDGSLRLRGDVRLSELKVKEVELGVDLSEVSLRPLELLRSPGSAAHPLLQDVGALVSGNLLLFGKPELLQLSGGMEILKLRYVQAVELETLLGAVKKPISPPPIAGASKEWLRFDVDLHAGKEVAIDNDLAKARLFGKLKLTGSNLRPGLLGAIETVEGSQAFYRGNALTLTKGELQFRDPASIDPVLDLAAQTQVQDYLVRVKAFGRLSERKVIFSSEPPLPEAEVLSLLTLGVTLSDRTNQEGKPRISSTGAGLGMGMEAIFSATGLNRHVQRYLPKNSVLRDVKVRLSTTLNPASGQVEPAWVLNSKLFTERLDLSVTQPMISGRGTRLQAEYQVNDRFSLRAQWDNESQDYGFGNPGLDLKIRLEWE